MKGLPLSLAGNTNYIPNKMRLVFGFFLILVTLSSAMAQYHTVVLKSNKSELSIREGGFLYKNILGVSSKTKLDVFVANPFTGKKRIVFYSDIDSVVFLAKPQRKYNFVVLLNGTDSAYTQISTFKGGEPTLIPKLYYTKEGSTKSSSDTIRFRLDKRFGIHLNGRINGSDSLDFLFDTGAGAVVITSSLINKRVNLKLDGSSLNSGSDGSQTVATSSGNSLVMGKLHWKNVSLVSIDYRGFPFDAVLGWVAFENKVVEIDYEKKYLVLHNILAIGADYSKVDMKIMDGIPFVKCTLTANGRSCEGWFDLDTGSDGGLVVGQLFASNNGMSSGMKRIGASESKGSAGIPYRQNIFLLPKIRIGEYELYQLPLSVNETDPSNSVPAENIGSSVLKRFNIMLDFKNNQAYIKPNKFIYSPVADKPEK